MNHYLTTLGARLPRIRKELGLTQQEMADLIGVSRPTICKVEKDPLMMSPLVAQSMFQGIVYAVGRRERAVTQFPLEVDGVLRDAVDTVRGLGEASGLGEPIVRAMALDVFEQGPDDATAWTIVEGVALCHRVLTELVSREAGLLAMLQLSSFDPIEFGDAIRAGADNSIELLWEGVN